MSASHTHYRKVRATLRNKLITHRQKSMQLATSVGYNTGLPLHNQNTFPGLFQAIFSTSKYRKQMKLLPTNYTGWPKKQATPKLSKTVLNRNKVCQ